MDWKQLLGRSVDGGLVGRVQFDQPGRWWDAPISPTRSPPSAQTLSEAEILFFDGGEHQSLAGWTNFKNGSDPNASGFGFYPSAPSNYD